MGNATSTHRIVAEGGAPVAPTPTPRPPTPPRPSPAPIPSAPAFVTYTLPFTANLIRTDEAMPSKKLEVRGRRELEDANWGEYLAATMRDAACEKYSSKVREYVPMEDWELTLSPSTEIVTDPKGFSYIVYSGTITWTSVACPLERVQREINWRIGDRMSMYEIDSEHWHVYIHPGAVTVS